ncbi:MAG TPA: quinone-dependent dihydroorotate dehydrogenase [Thermodesulfobacteriota bacterium]|nr:quinone-dependent dihydroorotate dehydrogenase [Thermodesulfobacteriota bacterium]
MYKEIIRPILDRLDSETWHDIARESLHIAEISPITLKILEQFTYGRRRFKDERLRVSIGGIEFENPLMVGAGWDKAGRAVEGLWQLGFSGVEVGSVLAYPQPGNPKPRQFMLSPEVALNWLGFNSPGMEVVARNLDRYRGKPIPIGISIGKNREVDTKDAPKAHALVARRLYDYASYFAINVSSPNTPGLRSLQDKGPLTDIVCAVNEAMEGMGERKPLFVKIAPELEDEAVNDVIDVVIDNRLTGIIATNTTESPQIKAKYGERWRNKPGGVSGNDGDFRRMATEKIAHIYREAGDRLEIIGVGGIKDTETALEKIRAGAKLLQIVTAIRSEGPTVAGKINRGLVEYMEREGIKDLREIVGIDVRR